ncbi:hypothetical protein CTRI78_v009768 [Colletotrichum trifolii]|uniref:Uncharacterized protein n=1 Tax=Colletotrichum trifolii TaxID=5466 RepID=A0A4R8QPX6_COLTR|nr:hypothetical protein CTRI78_v009768 [Colletotrichum trifolii]
MSSKRNSGDWTGPRRLLSVKDKLSGIVRRGGGLAKKTTLSVFADGRHERPSLDEGPKGFMRVQVQDFGTSSLEIDLNSLEAFRTAPPLERPTETEKNAQDQEPPKTSSTTPIADMFARKATTTVSTDVDTSSLSQYPPPIKRYSPSINASSVFNPGRVTAVERRASRAASYKAQESTTPAVNVTIVNSSHAQTHTPTPWPPPATPRPVATPGRTQTLTTASNSKQSNGAQFREPRRAPFVASRPAPHSTIASPNGPRQTTTTTTLVSDRLNAEKRYSTPSAISSLTLVPSTLPVDNGRADRRRSWQPAPTSVPSGTPTPSAPPSASAPWRDLSNRRASSRLLAADRLGWIRELEEGKNKKATINSDLPVLKTVQGSVADKLARFESRQQQATAAPITRSNSTRSRPSSIADTFSSFGGGMATTRSSLDSHRTSSVFSHYDDSFREKMELITKRKADDETEEKQEQPEKPALIKVTSAFVSVEKRNRQACVDKPREV